MRFLTHIFFVYVFFSFAAQAQNFIVLVDSISYQPVENVVISNQDGKVTVSNKLGKFKLEIFEPDDTLKFTHLAYIEKRIVAARLSDLNKIFLVSKVFVEEEVQIVGNRSAQNRIEFKELVNISGSNKSTYSTVGDLLKTASLLQIKDYGGYSGMKTVSSRGMSSENTIVLFNEARVNDLRSGVFDFSKLSSYSIDKIEIYKNADQESANSAAGGVIKIYSDNINNSNSGDLSIKLGSGRLQSYSGQLRGASSKMSYGFNFERTTAVNDFKYSFLGEKYNRNNSQFSKTFFSGNLGIKSNGSVIKIYSHYSHFKNGIPGYVVSNNTESSKADNVTDSFLGIVNSQFSIFGPLSMHTTLSYHNQLNIFTDPDQMIFINKERKDSRMNDLLITNRLRLNIPGLKITGGYEYNFASISGMDLIDNIEAAATNFRHGQKYFFSALSEISKPFAQLNTIIFNASINLSNIKEKLETENWNSSLSWSVGLALEPTIFPGMILKSHYFDNERIPTLNERYYSNVFFPTELKTEKYSGFDAGIEFDFNLLGENSISVAYFNIDGTDKIIWLPTRMGLQKPSNFGKVNTTGLEAALDKKMFRGALSLNINYILTNARNKNNFGPGDNSYNKLLLYSPRHQLKINSTYKLNNFSFSIFTQFESERFFSTDNSKRNRLKPFFITDISVDYSFTLFEQKSKLVLNAYNIFNEEYLIIQSYPMPLINYSITYNLELL